MLKADDAMEEPQPAGGFLDTGDGDIPDNLSISLEGFFKILDEEPPETASAYRRWSRLNGPFAGLELIHGESIQPSRLQKDTQMGFHQCKLDPGRVKFEEDSEPQYGTHESPPVLEDLNELGPSQYGSSNCMEEFNCKKESVMEFLFEPEGSFNDFSGLHQHLPTNSENLNISNPANYSSDWLRLSSCDDRSCSMDSFGGSFDNLMSNFDYPLSQRYMPKFSVSPENADGAGSFYSPHEDFVNNLYLNSRQGMDTGGELSSRIGPKESVSNVDNYSSVMQQNGGIDSSYIMLMKDSDSTNPRNIDLNAGDLSHSIVKDFAAPSMSLFVDPGTTSSIRTHIEANTGKTTNIMCKAHDSGFIISKSATDVENISREILPGQCLQPIISGGREAITYQKDKDEDQHLLLQNSCMTRDVKSDMLEESFDTSTTEISVIDVEALVPDVLCANESHDDMRFNSESSTDSSPIPFRRKTMSDRVDRSISNPAKQLASDSKKIFSSKKQKSLPDPASYHKHLNIPKRPSNTVQEDHARISLNVDDEPEILILDDISDPIHPSPPSVNVNPHPVLRRSGFSDIPHLSGGIRPRTDEDILNHRITLQDLSQPRSEASPPSGLLAVPLLRHQRIALAWMLQKESDTEFCRGGILADDQGLGKTISTIALILAERSPLSTPYVMEKSNEIKALTLDDDGDDDVSEVCVSRGTQNSSSVKTNRLIEQESSNTVPKARPAAGTLVVCPTSVLRQWAEELRNKVASKAKLTFLVYHGSNRTKDPDELAKYDVVLTTYAIVSMEVPKELVKDAEEKGKLDSFGLPSRPLTSKKRKSSPNSTMKTDNALLERTARPLARVRWFRVVLDEAQSIKNHRTHVARACCGLRAQRRWCLSGTPIQNAVDDLYSYFRFLRYRTLEAYKCFISAIKAPITRNPTNGYKKLQAVLKTVMLRRTKGTLLDGKPIISLPPKTVALAKVDFSEEERAFYSTLEAESQEQFKEYAAAGTVKQNYVNILLMLLRLRQACDHPLLVKGYDSNSIGRSSLEMAKKLPRDKQINLLSCLEACLAICTICNDSPEDTVVTICGHVFCNQCICEHLTGDDNICPSAQCKERLSITSVFSSGTLKSCISGYSNDDCFSVKSVRHIKNTSKMQEHSLPSESSKIRAALGILQSLPRSQYFSTVNNYVEANAESTESLGSNPGSCSLGIGEMSRSHTDKQSNAKATEKAIVFSQWTRMLDLLEIPLKDSSIQYRRLDGTMSVTAREKAVKDFNTLPEVTVIIMSLKAASLGLNMVAACHVLLLDLWWNPTTEDQAIDRAHRIGQTRPVTVSRLTVNDTVEDRILALQEKKREMVASAFGEDESGTRQTRLTFEDLNFLFNGRTDR